MRIVLVLLIVVSSQATARITFEGNWPEIHQTIFSRVVGTAFGRLFSDRLIQCKNRVRRANWIDDRSFKNVYATELTDAHQATFMDLQLTTLKNHYFATGQSPDITIKLANQPDKSALGWAHYSHSSEAQKEIIKIFTKDGSSQYAGRFVIELNGAHFNKYNENEWTGIVAHEMLHNLLHKHPNGDVVGLEKAYDDDWEIIAAERCITFNMQYEPNQTSVSNLLCGGRSSE